jgi:hypothetical protein
MWGTSSWFATEKVELRAELQNVGSVREGLTGPLAGYKKTLKACGGVPNTDVEDIRRHENDGFPMSALLPT